MQIARQIYGISTAENALVFFRNGEPAYITKRFDVNPDGSRRRKEDFATLAGKTAENAGPAFKYSSNYEEIGALIKKYIPAWKVEIEKYFSLVVFNYLFSNGDAHLKNFAILETGSGDHVLSPAYDLVNTRIHVNDSDFTLHNGLFKNDFRSESMKKHSHTGKNDFRELANRLGISSARTEKILANYCQQQTKVEALVKRSFLNDQTKRKFQELYLSKLKYLNYE